VRDTNYVDDVVLALMLAASSNEANGEVFNLGGEPANLLQLAEVISRIAGGPGHHCVPYPKEAKAVEVGDYMADWSKATQMLGWRPSTGLKQGMAATVDFYRQNREHYW
jgi:nucleoside-diphosphate-sugar epimerase